MASDWKTIPDLGNEHDFTTEPVIAGLYVGPRTVNVEGRAAIIHDLMTEEGPVAVWGSAVLDRKLALVVGREVRIEFTGEGEASKGKNPPKLFQVDYR